MRTYIAPNKKGEIAGIKVKALSLLTHNLELESVQPTCTGCIVKRLNICFKDELVEVGKEKEIHHRHLDTRPACFGNDPENKSKTPIFYVKA